ncbi:MAG: amino acid--tRNA ligase-related protein [Myxococcota bacterium]
MSSDGRRAPVPPVAPADGVALDARGLRSRATVLGALRETFAARGYLEVPTPALVQSPAMEEHLHAVAADGGFLRTSPEFALKRVLAAGLGRIYEIGPCFRARERGAWHRREFTMCEWYRAGGSLEDGIEETLGLIAAAAAALEVELPAPVVCTVRGVFLERTGLDPASASASDLSAHDESWDDAFARRWVTEVEPGLTGCVVVRDWPASQAALARIRDDGPWPVAERFEVYLHGVELANAFYELTDPAEQRRRFSSANAARVAAGESPHPIDEALIAALPSVPPTVGVALGVDRLVAALCRWDGIGPGRVDGPSSG